MAPNLGIKITATFTQTFTYLFGVCLFSISFLVFLNSSLSFVITERIGKRHGIGDAVGTLGFADELLALFACPFWGTLSDKIGVRAVSVTGYAIISLSLVMIVQAKNIYPQLLLARLCFALGASAVSTMVTAILPSITESSAHAYVPRTRSTTPRLAGFVGLFTGLGALIALSLFLPLPTIFADRGMTSANAIAHSFYVVGAVSLLTAFLCFVGLRDLPREENKNFKNLFQSIKRETSPAQSISSVNQFLQAVSLGLTDLDIGLAYVGGFVARASSVGISLFIPLFINEHFIQNGKCSSDNPENMKKTCHKAYVLASILTGVSQLVALLFAPVFGYLTSNFRKLNIPLLIGACTGIVGYISFALINHPDPESIEGKLGLYVIVTLIGISQISAIVCSLGILSRGVQQQMPPQISIQTNDETEVQSLIPDSNNNELNYVSRTELKGSIAGVYSLSGGAGILLLTKLGGFLFDNVSPGSPFVILAIFNGFLLIVGAFVALLNGIKRDRGDHDDDNDDVGGHDANENLIERNENDWNDVDEDLR